MKRIIVLITGIMIAATDLYAANGDLIVNGNLGVGTEFPNEKVEVTGNILLSGDNNIITRKGLLMMGTTDGSYAVDGDLLGGLGFWGYGTQHGELAFRAGYGFEMVDRSGDEPDLYYAHGSYDYTDLFLRDIYLRDLYVEGVKYFNIVDPRYKDESKRLAHSAIEGPEAAVYYRGEAKLDRGIATVSLPPYFEALTRAENRTVNLTAKFERANELLCPVAASDVKGGQFSIQAYGAQDTAVCNHKVYWEVKAERSDVDRLIVEQDMNDPVIKAKKAKNRVIPTKRYQAR